MASTLKTKKILTQWDASLSPNQHRDLDHQLERRQFLHGAAKATASALILPSMALFTACDQAGKNQQSTALKQEPWPSFSAVQDILFPDDHNGPSARDLNADAYLNFVLSSEDIDPQERDFIYQGINWLNKLANTRHKTNFINTTQIQQTQLITSIAKSESGERWLSYLLLYIFEALLSDPAYGSNPEGMGWRWLEHKPGFPHPSANKTYPYLLKR